MGDIAPGPNNTLAAAGFFEDSLDVDPTQGAFWLTTPSVLTTCAYVVQLAENGAMAWAHVLSGDQGESRAWDVAVDATGNVYVVGGFVDTVDFDPGPGVMQLISHGTNSNYDAFVVKYSPDGSLEWAFNLGGGGTDDAEQIEVDPFGNIDIVGEYTSIPDMDPGPGLFPLPDANGQGGFVVQLNSDGEFQWAFPIHTQWSIQTMGHLAVDDAGSLYVTGKTDNSYTDFDPGPDTLYRRGMFLAKYDNLGAVVWAGSISATANVIAPLVQVDQSHRVYFGALGQYDVDWGPDTVLPGLGCRFYTALYDSDGVFLDLYRSSLASVLQAIGTDLAIASDQGLLDVGRFQDTLDVDPGTDTLLLYPDGVNSYLRKLTVQGDLDWVVQWNGDYLIIETMTSDENGTVTLAGKHSCYPTGDTDMDPGAGSYPLPCAPYEGIFITKIGASPLQIHTVEPNSVQCVLYPVPADRYLQFTTNMELIGSTYAVRDATGRQVLTGVVTGTECAINVTSLAGGKYSLELCPEELFRVVRPFIIAE